MSAPIGRSVEDVTYPILTSLSARCDEAIRALTELRAGLDAGNGARVAGSLARIAALAPDFVRYDARLTVLVETDHGLLTRLVPRFAAWRNGAR